MRKILFLLFLALLAVTSFQLWNTQEYPSHTTPAEKEQTAEGEAAIGSNFHLTNQDGQTVQANDFRGQLMLIYFGFTHCPDICPVTLSTMSKAMAALGGKASGVVPIFITVDPARDTPAVLKDYLVNFDPRIVGLTGAPEQIKQVAGDYKAYFAKRNIPWSQGSSGEDHGQHNMGHNTENYAVDHSGFIYLMGKDGKYIRLFEANADAAEMAKSIEPHL